MELRHLRYFVAVGKCLSFTKAAEMLHVSQPPLSRQIQEFEEEIGTALFDRIGRKTSLTPAGAYLLTEAERLLEGIEAACRQSKVIADRTRALNIGCVNFFFNSNVMPFLETLKKEEPSLKIELRIMSTEAQERALLSGSIDIGFVRSWVRKDSLVFEQIAEENLALIFSDTLSDIPSTPEGCIAALAESPFIGMLRTVATGLVDAISASCSRLGYSPIPAYESDDAYSIIGLVASGLGWSIIPQVELNEIQGTGIKYVQLNEKIGIGLCYRTGELSAECTAFLHRVREYF